MLFFFKQKTAYEMRISDWSSDVCSSDLVEEHLGAGVVHHGADRLDGDAAADRLAQVDDEDRESLALLGHLVFRRRAREQQHQIAVLGAAGPYLLAAHDVAVALAPGAGQETQGIGAAGRLGDAEGLQAQLTLGDARQDRKSTRLNSSH